MLGRRQREICHAKKLSKNTFLPEFDSLPQFSMLVCDGLFRLPEDSFR
jgi:hypothetical protein